MLEGLAHAEAAVSDCLDAPAWALAEHDLVAALDAAHRLEQRLAAVKLTLVRELDGRGTATAQGASSTAVWLRDRLRLSVSAARRLVDLAGALDAGAPGVRAALAGGDISVEQARVIGDTVSTVRTSAGAEAAGKAVAVLVEWAGQFEPTLLRKLGTRILDHVAPEVAEAAARAALEAEARRASRDRHVTLSELSDGRLRLSGSLDAEAAGLLRAAIDPLTAPSGPDDRRSPGQRRHDALADLTGPLRRALVLRDRGCAFPGCDRPPRWCDAHHIHHWADGGRTSLTNAVLLCAHHHRHVHRGEWTVRLGGDGRPEFVPPAWLDPDRLPRRNHYHRRT
ncbi:DUF222 domain-containing protein [Micromonospora arida]|uniref:HNH endonuclease signature motif containing protein n=1 Tax=Micromonospora arida TaxID=2203715 RepID=UPI003CEAEF5E